MQLFVRAESTHALEVEDGQCVGDVRACVCAAEGLPNAEVSGGLLGLWVGLN